MVPEGMCTHPYHEGYVVQFAERFPHVYKTKNINSPDGEEDREGGMRICGGQRMAFYNDAVERLATIYYFWRHLASSQSQ